jgi:hypothetical protein
MSTAPVLLLLLRGKWAPISEPDCTLEIAAHSPNRVSRYPASAAPNTRTSGLPKGFPAKIGGSAVAINADKH